MQYKTADCQGSRCQQHHKNMMQETDIHKKFYKNTDSNSSSGNKDKSMVINNENSKINYFLPGPNQDNDKRMCTDITAATKRF